MTSHLATGPTALRLSVSALVRASAGGAPTPPDATLALAFFSQDDLPDPCVPIHGIRIEDAAAARAAAQLR